MQAVKEYSQNVAQFGEQRMASHLRYIASNYHETDRKLDVSGFTLLCLKQIAIAAFIIVHLLLSQLFDDTVFGSRFQVTRTVNVHLQ